ncbi:MAG: S26 family signal peptidase [Sphingorhabdus sp.]
MNSKTNSPRPLPLVEWLAKVREQQGGQRKRDRLLVCGALGTAILLATLVCPPPPLLVWNVTPSAPTGMYRLTQGAKIRVGDMAVTWVPPVARQWAAMRNYLPSNVPLVKRVAAVAGDHVCAVNADIFVNGKWIAARLARDGKGRPLPRWTGCVQLSPGDLFLIATDQPEAFDGRYFGVTRSRYVVGKATLLWQH